MRLLAEGYQVASVGRSLGIREATVRDWRDSPEGQRELAEARAARAETLKGAAEEARRVLKENAARAAQVLVDALVSPRAKTRATAAATILDRVGVPRTERVELHEDDGLDLSRLSDDELQALEQLRAKASRTGTDG